MSLIYGPRGESIDLSVYAQKPAKKSKKITPLIGEIAPDWNLPRVDNDKFRLNISNNLQFDTSRLKLADFRFMLDHYQINSSLSTLTFMLHQSEWHLDQLDSSAQDKKIKEWVIYNLEEVWSRLIRAMSVAFWAGFSPAALQFENDLVNNKVILNHIKDLPPEICDVKWKKVKAAGAPKAITSPDNASYQISSENAEDGKIGANYARVFDGIVRKGYQDIEVDNAFWYTLLKTGGDMTGRKLLRAAFQPWFFSLLIHMFSNRYFERFGEPLMIARAPFDDVIDVEGQKISGNRLMQGVQGLLRNGSFAVMPNNRVLNGDKEGDFEYTIEYLESQMRGADFDRYITKLDEEMSQALFTPLSNTSGGGNNGYNTGIIQNQNYGLILNALSSDMEEYINRYIIPPMVRLNFGDKVRCPRLRFKRRGVMDPETLRVIVSEVMRNGGKVDLPQLSEFLGLDIEQTKIVLGQDQNQQDPNADPNADPNSDPKDPKQPQKDTRVVRTDKPNAPKGENKKGAALKTAAAARLAGQVFSRQEPDIGCTTLYANWFDSAGINDSAADSDNGYNIFAGEVRAAFNMINDDPELKDVARDIFEGVIDAHMKSLVA